jgi:putative ABC transport system permease protein
VKILLLLSWKSLLNRRVTSLLSVLTIAIAVLLLLSVERVRSQTKQSFANTISDTDLIVGARSGQVNLLLYSVFRMGNPTQNISWKSYRKFAEDKRVAWTVPISLGDSHRSFRVLGTNADYFKYYKFSNKQPLRFVSGSGFNDQFSTVIGSQVAKNLGYTVGQKIIVAHGISDKSFNRHENSPFTVTGILAPTGTAVDKTVHVTLQAIEAIHKRPNAQQGNTQPSQITAFLIGTHSKMQIFSLQRKIANYKPQALSAILPGVALQELWSIMSIAEQALLIVAFFVVIAGMLGILSSLLTSLQARRREIAILRGMGASARQIVALLLAEVVFISNIGIIVGVVFMYLLTATFSGYIRSEYGLTFALDALNQNEIVFLISVQGLALIVGLIPAITGYRQSLADGMTVRS